MTFMTALSLVLAAAGREQGIDLGAILEGVAWFVIPIVAFMATVWLGIRALRARGDMTETESY